MTLPTNIKEWLNKRGIIDSVITNNNIDWNGTHIVIPIYDPSGNFLFNKYRRDPFGPDTEPKYKYEAGSSAQLYNAHKIKDIKQVIISEGETDVLRLESEGIVAVSSTGGAGTFRDEWIWLLSDKETSICYDNDEAGIKGAVKLLTKIDARLIIIPKDVHTKDITDFFQYHTLSDFENLKTISEKYSLLSEPLPKFKHSKDIQEYIKKYKFFRDNDILLKERYAKNHGQSFNHYEYIREVINNKIDSLFREIYRMKFQKNNINSSLNSGKITESDIARAKEIPLEHLYGGHLRLANGRAVGCCPFHNEKHGSFIIFLDKNRFHCFGCGVGSDGIDFVMRRDDCDFISAVKKLLNKN